jgi:cytochrome c oxidase subunit I
MERPDFSLPFSSEYPVKAIRHWLLLAVATLAVSGIAPLILLAGRASHFAERSFIKNSFADALVIHVDLSAVAWFLAIALLFWAMFTQARPPRIPYLRGAALGSYAAAVLCIAIAPLLGNGTSLFSNYIPVYTSPLFLMGIALLAAALVLGALDIRLSRRAPQSFAVTPPQAAQHFGILGSSFIVLMALFHFWWAFTRVEAPVTGMSAEAAQTYYELVFWAGGHILQLAYTQLLMVAWLWLGSKAGLDMKLSGKWLLVLFIIYPLVALLSPIGFLGDARPYDLDFYTQQMRHGGGLGALLLGVYLVYKLFTAGKPAKTERAAWVCLVTSMVVFLVGGVIGHMISGVNTIIPAHYHGSIVGTTLAFMGVIYLLLPRLGFGDVSLRKLTIAQPLLYGGGSIMHAVGFAIAGGHGAERKSVGAIDAAPAAMEAALQVMRLGGLLAVIGGGLFVVLVVIAWRKRSA